MSIALIPVGSEFDELREVITSNQSEAIRNLILGITPKKDFPGSRIPNRPARGGRTVDYIPGWWFIKQLNSLFDYNWDLIIEDQSVGKGQVWVRVRLVVRLKDGTTITKCAYGSSDIKVYKERPDQVIDIGDDLKSATTDGLKKAASMLGIASDIYGKREQEEISPTGVTNSQLVSLLKVAAQKGKQKEDVDKMSQEKFQVPIENLQPVQILQLIQEIRSAGGKE